MSVAPKLDCNLRQVVPFFRVSDMDRSVRFYIDGLGCTMKQKWVVDEKLRWCWLELGGAALMHAPMLGTPLGNSAKGFRSPFNAKTLSHSTVNSFPVVLKPPSRRSEFHVGHLPP